MADLRMPNLNKVIIAGRLTRDPEERSLPNGTPLCKLGLAYSRKIGAKGGDQREETLFINVTCWDKQAEIIRNFKLRKGRAVIVEGRLKANEWEDKATGQKRSTIEITADRVDPLDWEDRGSSGGGSRSSSAPSDEPLPEDDIPF